VPRKKVRAYITRKTQYVYGTVFIQNNSIHVPYVGLRYFQKQQIPTNAQVTPPTSTRRSRSRRCEFDI